MKKNIKILITGTHFTPAVAVIKELRKKEDIEIVYVGRKSTMEGDASLSIESQVIPGLGVKFIPLITGRMQRKFTFYTIPSLLKIPIGLIQSFFILINKRPDVILSFGGYVSLPIIFWGWLFSIPIITHQQTLVPSMTSKISDLFATKIAVSFEKNYLNNSKYVYTGNPLREEVIHPENNLAPEIKRIIAFAKEKNLPLILVTGGNQGSHIINKAVEGCIDKLIKFACVIHITGDNKFKDYENLSKFTNDRYVVKKWIGEDWGAILQRINLAISRAGINTLMEISFFCKPALVIPIPYLSDDEQGKNAAYFESLGLVKTLPQSKLSPVTLIQEIKDMLKSPPALDKDKKVKKVYVEDAAKRLVLETILLCKDV